MHQLPPRSRPVVAFLLLLAAAACTSAADRPNILLIVGDDMGYADVGFHRCPDIPTPNLNALAASGVRFTNGYVSGPYCSPTRAGLLTGKYQERFGHEFNPGLKDGLPLTETVLPARLKSAGYATGMVGKWHLGAQQGQHPLDKGFDEFFGFLAGGHDYFNDAGILRGRDQVEEPEYLTDAFAREGEKFIEKHKEGPFFLYFAFNAVHTPMQADDSRLARFSGIGDKRRQTYAAMMFALDEAVGRLRSKLAATGLEQNTLVCFISDNGGPTMPGVTVNGSINTPLRGSKRTTLEGGIRVPFLVSWPGHVKPGTYDRPVIQLDLNATALTAAGVTIDPAWTLDGVDLVPFLAGQNKAAPHEALYWRFGRQMAIRQGDFKLVRYDSNADTLTGDRGQPVTEAKLYNLVKDIGEANDLAAEMPDKVKELQGTWDQWNATLATPLWGFQEGGGGGEGDEATPAPKAKRAAKRAAAAKGQNP